MKKVVFLSLAAVLFLSSLFFGTGVSPAAADVHTILEFNTMIGVPRPYTGSANTMRGINGGGLPWVIRSASGEAKRNGKIEVKVRGLVLDPTDPAVIPSGRAGNKSIAHFQGSGELPEQAAQAELPLRSM